MPPQARSLRGAWRPGTVRRGAVQHGLGLCATAPPSTGDRGRTGPPSTSLSTSLPLSQKASPGSHVVTVMAASVQAHVPGERVPRQALSQPRTRRGFERRPVRAGWIQASAALRVPGGLAPGLQWEARQQHPRQSTPGCREPLCSQSSVQRGRAGLRAWPLGPAHSPAASQTSRTLPGPELSPEDREVTAVPSYRVAVRGEPARAGPVLSPGLELPCAMPSAAGGAGPPHRQGSWAPGVRAEHPLARQHPGLRAAPQPARSPPTPPCPPVQFSRPFLRETFTDTPTASVTVEGHAPMWPVHGSSDLGARHAVGNRPALPGRDRAHSSALVT